MNYSIIAKQGEFEVRIKATSKSANDTTVCMFAYVSNQFIPPYGFYVYNKLHQQHNHINEEAISAFLTKKNVALGRVRIEQQAQSGYVAKVFIHCETPRQIRRARVVLQDLWKHMLELADKPKCSTEKAIRQEFTAK